MDTLSFFISGMLVIFSIFIITFIIFRYSKLIEHKIMSVLSIIVVFLSILFSLTVSVYSSGVNGATPTPTITTTTAPDNRLVYTVQVKESVSLEPVANSQVIIEVDGEAAIIKTTDSNGLSVLVVDSSFAGQTARLIVESPGYEVYLQDVELTVAGLPEIVELKPEP